MNITIALNLALCSSFKKQIDLIGFFEIFVNVVHCVEISFFAVLKDPKMPKCIFNWDMAWKKMDDSQILIASARSKHEPRFDMIFLQYNTLNGHLMVACWEKIRALLF